LLTSTLKEYHISAPLSSHLRKSFRSLLEERGSSAFAADPPSLRFYKITLPPARLAQVIPVIVLVFRGNGLRQWRSLYGFRKKMPQDLRLSQLV